MRCNHTNCSKRQIGTDRLTQKRSLIKIKQCTIRRASCCSPTAVVPGIFDSSYPGMILLVVLVSRTCSIYSSTVAYLSSMRSCDIRRQEGACGSLLRGGCVVAHARRTHPLSCFMAVLRVWRLISSISVRSYLVLASTCLRHLLYRRPSLCDAVSYNTSQWYTVSHHGLRPTAPSTTLNVSHR